MPLQYFIKMVDPDRPLEFQLNKLQLRKVKSTDAIIGRRAYGRVIKVYVHGTLCAAKEIHPLLVDNVSLQEFETIRKSFYDEYINASQIHHPNVVQMLGIHWPVTAPQAKLPWLIMELMETSLKSFLEKHEQGKVHFILNYPFLLMLLNGSSSYMVRVSYTEIFLQTMFFLQNIWLLKLVILEWLKE